MNLAFTEEQRKSFIITTLLFIIMLLILFFIKFATTERIQELAGGGGGGLTVNFGDSDVGMGEDFTSKELKVSSQQPQKIQPAPSQDEDLVTSSDDDAVAVDQVNNVKKTPDKKPVTKPVPERPKVSNATNDALSSILNSSNKGGDGDDDTAGNKGKANGSLSSGNYYGEGGSGGGTGGGNGTGNGPGSGSGNGPGSGGGSGGGYSLGNRKALYKPDPNYVCSETGKVVVEVSVDKNGRTISVNPGVKGTTNSAKCLVDQARIAAMNTRWQADANAPEKQVGKIVYTFSLN
ncbi:MAG TPA: energy transducer TonB [Flavobacterium sp.]|jgi:hypothetical protein